MAEHKIIVHVRGVSKTFHQGGDSIHALRKVDFDTRAGELQMIVGPSGSGKTTLLSVIAGVLHFDEGEIDVLGRSLHDMSEKEVTEFRKANIGFIFQLYNLIPTLTIKENVAIPLLLNGYSHADAYAGAKKYLEIVGLGGREESRPQVLSGGQQQRVAIARALVHNPKIIICDEPTAALDADTGAKILELLKEIVNSDGRSVIVVTHDSRIFPYADRIARMDDGKIITHEETK